MIFFTIFSEEEESQEDEEENQAKDDDGSSDEYDKPLKVAKPKAKPVKKETKSKVCVSISWFLKYFT